MSSTEELALILENHFGVTKSESKLDSESAFLKHLKFKLSQRIIFFIRTDIDKLMQALYRIDVDDSASNEAFDLGEINKVSERLAELIISRQLKKIEYSRKFSS